MKSPEKEPAALRPQDGLGVYVHFPWCLKKCPYCDFLSVAVPSKDGPLDATAARRVLPHEQYADAVIREFQLRLSTLKFPAGGLRSVFFGGGTPSLWEPQALGRVLKEILSSLPLASEGVEVTVECNPTSFDAELGEKLALEGVNRVSLGVQALDEERLRFLGRLHDSAGGLEAVEDALGSRLPRVSADLIFGVHRQSPEFAVSDALAVARTGVTHLSAYALTIEPATRFGALDRKGQLPLLEESEVAQSFTSVSQALKKEGFHHYEISNFCKAGAESVHNQGYWLGRDYLGLGTGAFGTVSLGEERLRYRNHLNPERYMAAFGEGRSFDCFEEELSEKEKLTPEICLQEALLLGLRTSAGVDLAVTEELRGEVPESPERIAARERLESEGRLCVSGTNWRIPEQHWLFADGIIRDLL